MSENPKEQPTKNYVRLGGMAIMVFICLPYVYYSVRMNFYL